MDSTSFDVKVINQILLFVVGSIVAWQESKGYTKLDESWWRFA